MQFRQRAWNFLLVLYILTSLVTFPNSKVNNFTLEIFSNVSSKCFSLGYFSHEI